MTIAEVNRKRSETLKANWRVTKFIATVKGISTHEARHRLKGKAIPISEENHYSGKRFHYVVHTKKGKRHVTIVSNTALTKDQIKAKVTEDFNYTEEARHEEYASTDEIDIIRKWEPRDFVIDLKASTIDFGVMLKGEGS